MKNKIENSNNVALILECAKEIVAIGFEYLEEIEYDDFEEETDKIIVKALDFIKRTEWHSGLNEKNKVKSLKLFEEDIRNVIEEDSDFE